jgi:tetratricopeptide (TPR) repeat protein
MVEHLEGVLGIQADPQKDLLSIQSKSTPGSCEWISRRADFIQWAQKEESDQSPRMFYLVGLPATGKTVVTSYVVSFLQSKFQQNSCQYHFFPSGDRIKHTGAYILRSIAFQIAKVNSVFRSKLFELYETESVAFEHQKLLIIWEKIFQGILFKMDVGVPLFWVLDAFDEINSSDLLLRLFNKFRSKILIKIFVVSRPSANLPQMTMSTKDTLGDIRTYVERTVQDTLMVDDQVQKEIVDKVLKATNGSFLWVSLCLEELRMCHTQDDIQNAITDMLPGMESMYSRMIHSVAEQPVRSRKLAARILTWTVYSYRPLHVLELRAALELEFGSFINLEATIAQICGHLVTVHHSEVTPLHETVRVFLHENLSTLSTSGPQGHEYLALTCIQYLSNDRWGNLFTKAPDGLSRTRGTKEERHRQVASLEDAHPFFSYAASNWAFHVSKSNPCSDEVLSALANLGLLYRDQGKLAEAEQMFLRALAGKEKALGPDHPSTLDTVDNLGLLYRDQGKLAEAEQIYRRALAGREKALGLDHTSTLDTVNDLGTLYRAQGKLIEAEQMYRRALAGGKKAWGPDHTSTLDTVNNLGSLYAVQEQLTKTLASLPSDSGYQSATLPPNQEYVERQHSPQRSAIESGVVGNHDSFKPVEDTMSVPSADDEIASQRTMQRTQEARTGEYEIMQVMLANEELVAVVTDVLASVGREKFIRNFRRQLKRYYLELEHSVTLEPQKLAISLLRRRAARLWIATTLADRLGPEEENAFNWERLDVEHIDMRKRLNEWLYERYESTNFSTLHQNLSAEESGLGTVDISSNNRPSSTEDSSSEISDGESEDEKLKMQAPDLMEKLVPLFTTGPSFRLLLANTQLLKLPRSLSSLTRILMTIPTHDISYLDNFRQSYSDRLKRSVEGLCGYEWNWWPLQQPQPRLAKGYVRIRWRCVCRFLAMKYADSC